MNAQMGGLNIANPEIEMSSWVPKEIQGKYGSLSRYYSMDGNAPSGNILSFDEAKLKELVKDFEERGFVCRKDDGLVSLACGYIN